MFRIASKALKAPIRKTGLLPISGMGFLQNKSNYTVISPSPLNMNIFSRFSFSSYNDPRRPDQSAQNQQTPSMSSEEAKNMIKQFQTYFSDKTPGMHTNYRYDSKVVYQYFEVGGHKIAKTEYTLRLLLAAGVGGLAHYFISPWIAVIPYVVVLFYSFALYNLNSQLRKQIIRIELLDDSTVKLALHTKEIVCDIRDFQLHGTESHIGEGNMVAYAINLNVREKKTSKLHEKLYVMIDMDSNPLTNTCRLPNMDLFKAIVNANADEVAKFIYSGPKGEEKKQQKKDRKTGDEIIIE